jgi:hypothetical protein
LEDGKVVSETYARGSQEKASDGLIVKAISLLAAVLVIAGLGYAATTGARHKAALATADCEPNLSPSGLQCTTVPMLISQYAGVTTPVTKQLATDVTAYAANERHSLVAARAALTAAATSESQLGNGLARFPFPPAVAAIAAELVRDTDALARLTAEQAGSASLARMRSFNGRVQSASAVVQAELRLMAKALDVRPTVSEEP